MGQESVETVPLTLGHLLEYHQKDHLFLQAALAQRFEELFNEVLGAVEIALPPQNGVSQNSFKVLRSRVLRAGNNKIREMKELLGDYLVVRAFDHERTQIQFHGRGKNK